MFFNKVTQRYFFLFLNLFLELQLIAGTLHQYPLVMPNVRPLNNESHLCTSIALDPTKEIFITAFEPTMLKVNAHHMLIKGCSMPGSKANVFNCEVMAVKDEGLESAESICKKNSNLKNELLFVWTKNVGKLVLPKDVAFKVGGKTGINYLVLQVHYVDNEPFKDGSTDDSGIIIHYTKEPKSKEAGVFNTGVGGRILPHSTQYMEGACHFKEDKIIHPFFFRVHTHSLGRVVSAYKVDNKSNWILIGKKDPQLPQVYYPVTKKMTLSKGDILAMRCTMKSDRNEVTRIGTFIEDEMCNIYLMYWTDGPILKRNSCYSMGPPLYYWSSNPEFKNIPQSDASTLPVGESAQEKGFFDIPI